MENRIGKEKSEEENPESKDVEEAAGEESGDNGENQKENGEDKDENKSAVHQPTEEEICKAAEEAMEFAWGWFWENDTDHIDENDVCMEEYDGAAEWPYYRVDYGDIKTVEDVLELTRHYYTENIAKKMISYKEWHEKDNALYVSADEGLGGVFSDYCEIVVQQVSETEYTLTVTKHFVDEDYEDSVEEDSHEVRYKYVDGYWVFDDLIDVGIMPVYLSTGTKQSVEFSGRELESEIENIRTVYYDIQNNISNFRVEDGGGGTIRYFDSHEKIRKITVKKDSYEEAMQNYPLMTGYNAEYYFDEKEQLLFVFLFNSEGQEHRFYMRNGAGCIRYINDEKNVRDYPNGIDPLQISELGEFCMLAQLEIAWAYGG